MATAPARERILSVSELTRRIKDVVEGYFPALWVRGEVTGYKKAPSGHHYFALKDRSALLDCVIYSKEASRLRVAVSDGKAIEAFGRISLYEQRGRYQLIVETLRLAGLGDRQLAYEELKNRLQAEGLFDPARKRPLPRYPSRIGLVTSAKGAAIHDLVTVLRARWPSIGIVLAPVPVQGEGASAEIADAIRRFNRYGKVDLLIVGRGGGSADDLWSFNEEPVLRAMAASTLPVISAVGHEGDQTLADLVADVRAATPSNAAEIAVRDRAEIAHRIGLGMKRLERAMRHALDLRRQTLDHALGKYAFGNLLDVFEDWRRRVGEHVARLRHLLRHRVEGWRLRLEALGGAYGLREWPQQIEMRREVVVEQRERLADLLRAHLDAREVRARGYADRLRALSPRLVMERGYCLVRGPDGTLLRAADGLAVGDLIHVEFARGEADARVDTVRRGDDHGA